jgi:5S rRNA maturation endonuclease (ribonuclease M5)
MTRDEVIAANPIDNFVRSRGHELKRAGENFVISGCPVTQHKRGHRPVMIYPKTQSWSCHDCKKGGSVIDWLVYERGISAVDAMQLLGARQNGFEPVATLVKTYDYTDESGNLLFQTCRYEPKDFKQRQPDGKGGWIWNLQGVRRILYRLSELLRGLKRGLPVIVTEGEKDADAIAKLGLPLAVTCNPLGAGKWRHEYSETLRGANVFVIADKDKDGRKHAQQLAVSMHGKAKRVAVLELPNHNGQNVKDASDWLALAATSRSWPSCWMLRGSGCRLPNCQRMQLPTHANDDDAGEGHDEKSGQKSAATRLIDFASAFAFFHDPEDRPFVRLKVDGHTEVWPVESSKFQNYSLAFITSARVRRSIEMRLEMQSRHLPDALAMTAQRSRFFCASRHIAKTF